MKKLLFANVLIFFFATGLFAQCENWTSNPEKARNDLSSVWLPGGFASSIDLRLLDAISNLPGRITCPR